MPSLVLISLGGSVTRKGTINYTQQADGTIIKAPANALNPSLPFSAVNAPYYNQLRELVVSHTGLEIGATIILDYTIETKPGFAATQEFLHRFNDPSPIDDYTLTVSAPGELTWHGGMINGKEINFIWQTIKEKCVNNEGT